MHRDFLITLYMEDGEKYKYGGMRLDQTLSFPVSMEISPVAAG
jgi:hypothetical protein